MEKEFRKLYKLKSTPSGKKLYTYMAAILEVTKMDIGKAYPLNDFFKNFQTHLKKGRIAAIGSGYVLTEKGMDYFRDRYNVGNKQKVERSEVDIIKKFITSVGSESLDWEPVPIK